MRERFEKAFVWLLLLSAAMTVLSIPVLLMGIGGGSAQLLRAGQATMGTARMAQLGAFLLFGGVGLLAFTVITGMLMGVAERRGVRKIDPNVRVMARYAMNRRNEMALAEWEYDDPDMRFFVRLYLSNHRKAEFECVKAVFLQCGEGMTGEAHFQGRWLGMFRPHLGVTPQTVYQQQNAAP